MGLTIQRTRLWATRRADAIAGIAIIAIVAGLMVPLPALAQAGQAKPSSAADAQPSGAAAQAAAPTPGEGADADGDATDQPDASASKAPPWTVRHWEVIDQISETPPEMDGRVEARKPVVTFESLKGWQLIGHDGGLGEVRKSVQQQLFNRPSLELAFFSYAAEGGWMELNPPAPIPLGRESDSIFLWVYGPRWQRGVGKITVKLLDEKGELLKVDMGPLKWSYWFLKQSPVGRTLGPNAAFAGFEIHNLPRREAGPATIYLALLDAGCPLREKLPDKYARLPEKLPFPTTPDTILPTSKVTGALRVQKAGKAYLFEYNGPDAHFQYRYTPTNGTLDDLEIVSPAGAFKPAAESGFVFEFGGKPLTGPFVATTPMKTNSLTGREGAETVFSKNLKPTLVREELAGDALRVVWRFEKAGEGVDMSYLFHMKGKSLIVEMSCPGGRVVGSQYGVALNPPEGKTVAFSDFSTMAGPGILCTRDLFVSLAADWYVSNASFWPGRVPRGEVKAGRLAYTYVPANGIQFGYGPMTDGRRNDFFERVFITASPDFQEVIWNIPNPPSPMGHITKKNLYVMMIGATAGVGAMRQDYTKSFPERTALLKRYGVDHVLCMHHAPMYSRGGGKRDPFFMTTSASLGQEGGLPAIQRYMDSLKAMGWVPGIYTTYELMSPQARHWDPNAVSYTAVGAWKDPHCQYQSIDTKPTAVPALVEEWSAKMRDTFHASACYQDVTTANRPAAYVDFDHRVKDGGMVRTAFAGLGLGMLREREIMNGPVFSEGGGHAYYAGLVDGNYPNPVKGTDRQPFLLDFELLKMHPLMTDIMMHYVHYTKDLDRYICAAVAFGHMGYVGAGAVTNGYMDFDRNSDVPASLRIYFMMQQLQEQYLLERATTIRYFDGKALLDTSAAVRTDAYKRNQVYVEYATGLRIWVNGNFDQPWTVVHEGKPYELPPTGWMAAQSNRLFQFSGMSGGHRVDYAYTPEYTYVDGRGVKTAFVGVTTNAQVIVKKSATELEVIPVSLGAEQPISLEIVPSLLGIATASVKVVTLDVAGKAVGEAKSIRNDRPTPLEIKEGCFSFRLTGT